MKDEEVKAKSDRANKMDPKKIEQKGQESQIEETLSVFVSESKGIIQTKDLTERGIHPEQFQRYLKKSGKIEKVAHGMYVNVDEFTDEFQLLQTRFKRGVFSYETALFLHDLTDVPPFDYHMTFPQGYNNKHLAEAGVIPSYAVANRYDLGVITLESPSGSPIRVYDVEKTLCDMFMPSHKADKDVQLTALRRYMKRKDKNFSRLMQYAKILQVDKILRPYVEALL
ncbi:type IV toxin-antitoxin system AbiEi family antitoxin domain-containing protein [uncultured Trichococcus sp.]|uniref:type IV toxin-antitoxin system AbiEi family antitoxin domain-containing protein n=1 Tax=uncultured Trichococcus sp. TaxID=189665 RepID=UPI0029C69039|nr:type IV toxin-antitoxin system AbiEi family antitoxin domain-containing protein [uncultured Trichococcus sp.]